jgi:hypothetical protein
MCAYAFGFVPLWLGGGYRLTESGQVRVFLGIPTGIAAPDVAEWQPFIGHFQPEYHWPTGEISPRCDVIGWLYFPLCSLVRSGHPTVRLLDERGQIIASPKLPGGFRFHPLRGSSLEPLLRSPSP